MHVFYCPQKRGFLGGVKKHQETSKTPLLQKKNPETLRFLNFIGEAKQNRTADLLNAMASGGGQNEYIWIKWTK